MALEVKESIRLFSGVNKTQSWLMRPRLVEGEAFESWLYRLARANGIDTLSLTGMIVGEDAVNQLRDKGVASSWSAEETKRIAKYLSVHTQVPENQITASMLRDTENLKFLGSNQSYDHLFLRDTPSNGWKNYFQYCSKCLATDKEPYLRSVWRFASITHCLKHSTLLLYCCPHCRSSLTLSSVFGAAFDRCCSCQRNLVVKTHEGTPIEQKYTDFQTKIWDSVYAGNYDIFQSVTFNNLALDCIGVFKSYRRRSALIKFAKQNRNTSLKPLSTNFALATSYERYAAQSMLLAAKYRYTSPSEWG